MAKNGDTMPKCKTCSSPVVWIRTRVGRSMPCDPERVHAWRPPTPAEGVSAPGERVTLITDVGDVLTAFMQGGMGWTSVVGRISHFATCPQADQHRKDDRQTTLFDSDSS